MTDVNWHRDRVDKTGNLLLILTGATLLVLLIEMGLNGLQYQLISDVISGDYTSTAELVERAQANYSFRLIEVTARLALQVAASITFLVWVFRSDALARALGSDRMGHTPGWSVGWFFVPFASLIKPYFVLKEIYFGTVLPRTYDLKFDEPAGLTMMRIWWLISIADKLFLAVLPQLTSHTEGLQAKLAVTNILAASSALSIVATALTLLVVMDFAREQQLAESAALQPTHALV